MNIQINYSQEQIDRLKAINDRIEAAKKEYWEEQEKISTEIGADVHKVLGFLYFNKRVKKRIDTLRARYEDVDSVRLVYLVHYTKFDKFAIARFSSVKDDGSIGNSIDTTFFKDMSFEEFDGSIEEGRKIVKKALKNNNEL